MNGNKRRFTNPIASVFSKHADEGCVPNRNLLGYAFGLGGQNMTYSYISGWLRYFCINLLHIDSLKVGTLFFASYFWDAINDPVIGSIVDRRRSKNGEKLRPYLINTPPLIAALSFALFFRVGDMSEGMRIAYILLVYFAWDFFYSFQDVALWGMISVSSPLSQERSRAAKWAGIGAGAGSALGGTFQMIRSFLEGVGMSDYHIFLTCAFFFCIVGEMISMSAHKVKEQVQSEVPQESFLKTLSYLRYNKTLLLISLARLLNFLSLKLQNAYFFESSCGGIFPGVDGKQLDFLFGLITGIPSALAVFFATQIAHKAGGMKRLLIISEVVSITVRSVSYFIGFKTPAQVAAVGVLLSLSGILTSVKDFAHRSLTSDSIDYVEWKTGVRIEGVSFAMQNLVSKLGSGFTSIIEGTLLKLLNYNSKLDRSMQNPVFMKWQWPMYILGPAVGAILYITAISFVEDNKEKQLRIEAELKIRRQKAEELKAAQSATVQ